MLNLFTYVIEHDLGLAPNPFFGYCTLAVCKSDLRKNKVLKVGDWIIGTGSKSLEKKSGRQQIGKLIYAMEVNEILPVEDYWDDIRFQDKKPNIYGSLVKMYGDNIYEKAATGKWIQHLSAHSLPNGEVNEDYVKDDIRGKRILISTNFYYLGANSIKIPKELSEFIVKRQGYKYKDFDLKNKESFISWVKSLKISPGVYGDPIDWINYSQTNLLGEF